MSLDVDGFDELVTGGTATIAIRSDHRLIKLAQKLPWDEMLHCVLPDLQRTEKKHWWMGRPLR
ncbi:TPA: DDE transposase, partial [Legionella pneumophila]|nr:DDE transposase [Legionella pneumophila]HAT8718439.1 DDE transposase [Legionella pneumophila]